MNLIYFVSFMFSQQLFAYSSMDATESGSLPVFQKNPALPATKESTMGFEHRQQKTDMKGTRVWETSQTDYRTKQNIETTEMGIHGNLGSEMNFGIKGSYMQKEEQSTNSNSRYARVPAIETYEDKQLNVNLATDLTATLRLGANVNIVSSKSDFLGSFGTDENDRSDFSGTLYGVGIGGFFSNSEMGAGLTYQMPIRGKVNLLGESKATSRPSFIGVSSHFKVNSSILLGLGYDKYFHHSDELRQQTTSRQRQTRISPHGVGLETELYPLQSMRLGAEFGLMSKLHLRTTLFRESTVWVFNDEEKIEKVTDDKLQNSFFRIKAALAIKDQNIDSSVGFIYANRKHQPIKESNQSFSTSAVEKSLIIGISATL